MSERKGVVTRLVARLSPQFAENWAKSPGRLFRSTLKRLSLYFDEHNVRDKVENIHDLSWKAMEGAASIQHAKAEAEYAKAENDKIEAELKRRALESKVRHESADADKAEADAGIAKVREIQARIELLKQLKEIGTSVSLDNSLNLVVGAAPPQLPLELFNDFVGLNEILDLGPSMIRITVQRGLFPDGKVHVGQIEWLVKVGTRVEQGQQIGILEVPTSPASAYQIRSPADGIMLFVLPIREATLPAEAALAIMLSDASPAPA